MTIIAAFAPHYTRGQTVTPGAAALSTIIGHSKKTLCLTNLGTSVVYVRSYRLADNPAGVAATIADYPVPAGAQVTISKPQDDDSLSYIAPSGSASLHIISGEGF